MMKRKLLAFALAPMMPSVFFIFAMHFPDIQTASTVLLFSIPFSYLPCWLFGVLLTKLLESRNALTVTNMTLCGSLLGAVVYYIFVLVFSASLGSNIPAMPQVSALLIGAALGMSVSMPFSLIAGFPLYKSRAARVTNSDNHP